MVGLLLDKTAAVWRFANNPGSMPGQSDTQVYAAIPCAIVPISSFDQPQPYAYEATHVIWVPNWLVLRKEDEIRYGRRPPDGFGTVLPYIFTINGRRQFSLGGSQAAYYAREKE